MTETIYTPEGYVYDMEPQDYDEIEAERAWYEAEAKAELDAERAYGQYESMPQISVAEANAEVAAMIADSEYEPYEPSPYNGDDADLPF